MMFESEQDLPNDIGSLKMLVLDLTRRLQNANHTIAAERKISQVALQQAEYYRLRLSEMTQSFRVESAKIRHIQHKTTFQDESKKYEENKVLGQSLHEQLRLAELDYQMTGYNSYIPLKLTKLRNKVQHFEKQQESQKKLLQQYIEIDKLNEDLVHVIQQNNIEKTLTLLRQGADVNYMDTAGFLPIHYASSNGYVEIAQMLLDYQSDYTAYLTGVSPLVLAAKQGHIQIVKILLQYGANIEEKGSDGVPALIVALLQRQFATVEFLLQSGADVNSKDIHENTALHYATRLPRENHSMIEYLLSMGASKTMINKKEMTAGQMAMYEKNNHAAYLINGQGPPNDEDINATQGLPSDNGNMRGMESRGGDGGLKKPPFVSTVNTGPGIGGGNGYNQSRRVDAIKGMRHSASLDTGLKIQQQQNAPFQQRVPLHMRTTGARNVSEQQQLQNQQQNQQQKSQPNKSKLQVKGLTINEEEVARDMLLGGALDEGDLEGGPSQLSGGMDGPVGAAGLHHSQSIASSVTFD